MDGSIMEKQEQSKTPNREFSGGFQNSKKQRIDNSLSVLTKKFVTLIKESPNNTIDLNETVKLLSV